MQITKALWAQHIGRMFKRHWKVQGQQVIRETGLEKDLVALGIPVVDINEVIKDIGKRKNEPVLIDIPKMEEPSLPLNENHPLFNETPAYLFKKHSVIVGGLDQAQLLSKAVRMEAKFPQQLNEKISEIDTISLDGVVRNCILSSHVFDAHQEKLPIFKDPQRPAWNFPRAYGISDKRRSFLTCEKLVQLCISQRRRDAPLFPVNFSDCIVPLEKDGDQLLFQLSMSKVLLASDPLREAWSTEDEQNVNNIPLPDIYPMKQTITLDKSHFYELKDVHPLRKGGKFNNLHTVLVHHNETEVKNIYETSVEESQILGRCVLFGFAAAVSQARSVFGNDIKRLPYPVVVQCIQTDGRLFDFCVFQLNTLELNGTEGSKNLFWLSPREELFISSEIKDGRPTLIGYNSTVFKYLLAFCCQYS